jgi:hypothetical protein
MKAARGEALAGCVARLRPASPPADDRSPCEAVGVRGTLLVARGWAAASDADHSRVAAAVRALRCRPAGSVAVGAAAWQDAGDLDRALGFVEEEQDAPVTDS